MKGYNTPADFHIAMNQLNEFIWEYQDFFPLI